MDGASEKSWKVKRDNVTQRFKKIQEDLERMDEFDAQIESEINRLRTLMRRTDTLFLYALGELTE
jgi:hypothetical protein